ncbi:helix-turn-helix domain-containing protein [Hymenobacter sp. HMF4947]|uniref:Helix-turn-helix domain-containing protein n=1 Tax=Hymenobacter ginkgonis TaxID=2682976 RepID=A0A7K1TBE8_9BACT|nr:helix-turn-helix domain-containing protein [Hymenobacter ginkgonis]MVN75727.1 helix-turn-helix domain-containing protein [Hymenobacter ginkgonis]
MKHITILVLASDAVVGSIEGPHKVLSQANDLLVSQGRAPAFDIELVGLTRQQTFNQGLFTLHTHRTIHDDFQTDLVLIPAPNGDLPAAVAANEAFLPWIVRQYRGGAEVASLCMGAFILAATGLVDGRACTTHWLVAEQFAALYPAVRLVPEQLITDEQGVYSSGGAYSCLNLVLYLVEKYVGREVAATCAKVFQLDMGRRSQSPFALFRGQKDHADAPVRTAQEFIETHFADRHAVEDLAARACLSRRSFERRFRQATGNAVAEYVQRVKIEAAKQRLESSTDQVNEVMYAVGYADAKAFRALFKKLTGVSPVAYRAKYRRQVPALAA